jgi:hypothetical protein
MESLGEPVVNIDSIFAPIFSDLTSVPVASTNISAPAAAGKAAGLDVIYSFAAFLDTVPPLKGRLQLLEYPFLFQGPVLETCTWRWACLVTLVVGIPISADAHKPVLQSLNPES